jgi:hypothetical protein
MCVSSEVAGRGRAIDVGGKELLDEWKDRVPGDRAWRARDDDLDVFAPDQDIQAGFRRRNGHRSEREGCGLVSRYDLEAGS